jgi:two-component system OmpR family sensor kinase
VARGIYLKKYELESLLKSFLLFFTLQMVLLGVIFVQSYKQGRHAIDDQVRNQMKICSFDLKCEGLKLDFVPKSKETQVRKLFKEGDLYAYFDVPTADDYMLKVILPQKRYEAMITALKKELIQKFILYALLIALLSFLFSLYALRPLKRALQLNEEFIRDILHDINTPLSSMLVNFKLFQKEIGENRKIERMQSNISTILSLQNNLKAFLDDSPLQKERFALAKRVGERIAYFQTLHPGISFLVQVEDYTLETNEDAFVRILDNLLGNACKYNDQDGTVQVVTQDYLLLIKDSGRGIQNVKKVFERYYKESDRGVGIGMHIVKKLCDALGIDIRIESEVGKGTIVALDLGKVIVK